MNLIQLISGLTVVSLIGSVVFGAIVPVQEGTGRVVYAFGEVQEQTLKPGLNLVTPFINSTRSVDVSTKAVPESFAGLTEDGQTITITGTVNYNVNPAHLTQIARVVILSGDVEKDAETIKNIALQPILLAVVKQVTASYSMTEIVSNQAKVSQQIVEGINAKLKGQSIINLQSFVITGFVLDPEVQQSIEGKAIAIQAQQKALIDLETAKTIAKNNEIISNSLTPTLLQSEAIKNWNGNSAVFNVGGSSESSIPIIVNSNNTPKQ